MAVCTLTLSSTSEGPLLLLLRAAGIGALLLRILRIRAFALDSGIPLDLRLLLLLRLISRSLSLVVCSPLAGLLGRRETAKAGSPDVADRIHGFGEVEGSECFI